MIRTATVRDLDAVTAYLARRLAGEGGPARYRRFLEYTWLRDKPDLGVLIDDGGAIRGFIGAIYATRGAHRYCNLTSIAVDESHRRLTLQMFAALLRPKDVTFTCFSASEQIAKILDFFKFQHRASERVIVGPVSGLSSVWRSRRIRVLTAPRELEAALDDEQREISRDHRSYRCGQLLLVDGASRCFVITVRRGRGARAFADIIHASDPEMLVAHVPRLHLPLLRAHGTVLTGIDRRWMPQPPRASFLYTKLRPVYARSQSVAFDEIDALYSELVPMYGAR